MDSLKLARHLFRAGQYLESISAANNCVTQHTDVAALLLKSKCYFEMGQFAEAYVHLETVVANYNELGCFDQRIGLAHMLERQLRYQEAMKMAHQIFYDVSKLQSCLSQYINRLADELDKNS